MSSAYIYDAIRTPRGKGREGGALNGVTPVELQERLIAAVLERNGCTPDAIDDIILGCVTQVGEQGGNIAKVAALYSGLPDSVSGITRLVNRAEILPKSLHSIAGFPIACRVSRSIVIAHLVSTPVTSRQ
jgi:acetyl-CoA acetyltransferase